MINKLAQEINANAINKGFYDGQPNHFDPVWISNRLMLIVSELAEGLEGVRNGNLSSEPKSGGLGEELADACIRIFDLAYSMKIDMEKAIQDKHEFNLSRPYKHGRVAL
jgi:NTP pyrophosphatase (non-canonical NTP hydrolase)